MQIPAPFDWNFRLKKHPFWDLLTNHSGKDCSLFPEFKILQFQLILSHINRICSIIVKTTSWSNISCTSDLKFPVQVVKGCEYLLFSLFKGRYLVDNVCGYFLVHNFQTSLKGTQFFVFFQNSWCQGDGCNGKKLVEVRGLFSEDVCCSCPSTTAIQIQYLSISFCTSPFLSALL